MDASKINTATVATNLDNYSYRYFHTAVEVAAQARNWIGDNAGWLRDGASFKQLTIQGLKLANGSVVQTYEQWENGVWTPVSYSDAEYLTLDASGNLVATNGTDGLLPSEILEADGNLLTYKMPATNIRFSIELSSDVMGNWYLTDWISPQLSATLYNYMVAPTTKSACAGTSTSTSATTWFNTCRTSFLNDYVALKGGLKAVQNEAAHANYYDITQKTLLSHCH